MLGAIAGDIIGSVHEAHPIKRKDFELFTEGSRFTDDTVLTVAVADCLLHGKAYAQTFRDYVARYPDRGYGASFRRWAQQPGSGAYGSYGNGAAMRVSPVAWACEEYEEILAEAERSASVTHDHPEGIKGAQATATAIFMARLHYDKPAIRDAIARRFDYELSRSLDDIREGYRFDSSCQGSVPESIIAFLESDGYEDAVRNAVSLGGDADTMACIAGAIAEAYYGGVPDRIKEATFKRLVPPFVAVLSDFRRNYVMPRYG